MKRNMTQVMAVFLTLVLLLFTAGCQTAPASTTAAPTGSTTTTGTGNSTAATTAAANTGSKDIRVWVPPFGTEDTLDKEVWTEMMAGFVEKTGANIELQVIGWDAYPDKYLSGINSGNGPDMGYMYADMFPDFIEMGAVEDLSSYLTDAQKETFLYEKEGFIMGKQYALPMILGNPRIMYFNKDILTASGVALPTEPISWTDFFAAAQKCTKDTDGDGKTDQWGTMQGWGAKTYGVIQETFTPYLIQAGGQMYADDGKTATFGSEAGIKAAQFIYDLIYTYKVMPADVSGMADTDTLEQFKNGKVAFYCTSTSAASQLPETLNWGYIPSLKESQAGTMMVADQLVLMSAARNKQLTYDLMIHVLSGPSQTLFHQKLSAFPPVATDEEYHDNPAFKTMYETQSDLLHTEKPVKGAFKMNDYLFKNLQLVVMGEMDPAEAVKTAQDYANEQLKD
ncbi:MAG: sugar ABC transporter substrate-binding protein [Clostridiaceae bacterium]|nr:sugar ABC transporter substrate-binding protein [Clostridiaceae bacterium]